VIAVDASESNSASANRQSTIIEDNLTKTKRVCASFIDHFLVNSHSQKQASGKSNAGNNAPTIKYFCSFVEDDCNLNAFSSDESNGRSPSNISSVFLNY
jgi:hypothetical protein